MDEPRIVVGPLLRYVGPDAATIWVETSQQCSVTVRLDGSAPDVSAPTWGMHGHHYALVVVEGLAPGTDAPYYLDLNGRQLWPDPASELPPSTIRTPDGGNHLRLTFGSCRRVAPFDDAGLEKYGADALVALAQRMAEGDAEQWPQVLLLVGDQIYADEPSAAMTRRLIAAHRGSDWDDVREEAQNFEEYTWLYEESWMVPEVRWLLSTVPTCMILDDHDLRDDWNSSWSWRQEVTRQPWWRDRVVGAFSSYWVYQHLGNLSPKELAEDELYRQVREAADDVTRATLVDSFAWRADKQPSSTRWSFYRDFGNTRLLVVDSRCSRHLEPDQRAMLDAVEWDWLVDHARADVDHLLIGTTLPYLMLPGIHHLEGWDESTARGAWGRTYAKVAERARRSIDLEHWPAFRASFNALTELIVERASSEHAPASILVLSGDVHNSYVTEAHHPQLDRSPTRVHQLVMSPLRNPLQRRIQRANQFLRTDVANRVLRGLARRAGVVDPPVHWTVDQGPWFDNGVMTVEIHDRSAMVAVETAIHKGGTQLLRPRRGLPLA